MTAPKQPQAARTRLAPGEHSIDRVKPFEHRGNWRIKWRIRTLDGKLHTKTNEAPTKGMARRKAKEEAVRMLATPGDGQWTVSHQVTKYLTERVEPKLSKDSLAPATQRRYKLAYHRMMGICRDRNCKHKHTIAGLTIHDATQPRALVNCLEELAKLHGEKTAKHAKIILSKYLMAELMLDRLIQYNPLPGLPMNLRQKPDPDNDRSSYALTTDEYQRVYHYLMHADPEDVTAPKRGKYDRQYRVTIRAAVIDFILLQMSTGCRTSEVAYRRPEDFTMDDEGNLSIHLKDADTKTRRGRWVTVLHPDVSTRIGARIMATPKGMPIFPKADDPEEFWDDSSRNRALTAMYRDELRVKCDVPAFLSSRGHNWRTTLNTRTAHVLPESTRVQQLGHTAAVNRRHYTDKIDSNELVAAATFLRGEGSHEGTSSGTSR